MIRSKVTVYGKIKGQPEIKANKEQKKFLSILMTVAVSDNSGQSQNIDISVYKRDFSDAEVSLYIPGKMIEVKGDLNIRKRDEKIFLNLYADDIKIQTEVPEKSIQGTLFFRGKIGKKIEEKTGKNSKEYIQFSAFSAEKVADGFEYIWVSFLLPDDLKEDWLKPEIKIEIEGDISFSIYNSKLSLSCFPKSIKQSISESHNL